MGQSLFFMPREISIKYIRFWRRPQRGIVQEDFLKTVLKILGAKRHEDIDIKMCITNIYVDIIIL